MLKSSTIACIVAGVSSNDCVYSAAAVGVADGSSGTYDRLLLVFSTNEHHHALTETDVVARGCLCYLLNYANAPHLAQNAFEKLSSLTQYKNAAVAFDVSGLEEEEAKSIKAFAEGRSNVSIIKQDLSQQQAIKFHQEFRSISRLDNSVAPLAAVACDFA